MKDHSPLRASPVRQTKLTAARPILFSGPMVRALLAGTKTQTRRIAKPQPRVNDNGSWSWETGRSYGWTGSSGTHWPPTPEVLATQCPYGAPGDLLWVRETCLAEELSRPELTRPATRRERQVMNRITVTELNDLDGADGVRYLADDDWRQIENTPQAGEAWSALFHYRGCGKGRIGNQVSSIHMPRWASRLTLEITDVRVERLQDVSEADAKAEGTVYGPAARHGAHDPRWILGRCRDCRHWDTNLLPNGGKRPSCGYHYLDAAGPQPQYGDAGQGCSTSFAIGDGADETAAFQFRHFWDRINGASAVGHWAANPWVWAVSFRVHKQNVDQFLAREGERSEVRANTNNTPGEV